MLPALSSLRVALFPSCFRATFAARYATLPPTQQVAGSMDELADLLGEAADENPLKSFGGAQDVEKRSSGTPYKPFMPNRLLRPHQLTLNARQNKQTRRKKPLAVAPPSRECRLNDPFHQLGINPLVFSLNKSVLREYVSEMGKIYPRSITGLTAKNQRKIGQAIRRAKMMGVIPILSKPTSPRDRR